MSDSSVQENELRRSKPCFVPDCDDVSVVHFHCGTLLIDSLAEPPVAIQGSAVFGSSVLLHFLVPTLL